MKEVFDLIFQKEQDKESSFVSVNTLIGSGKQPPTEFTYIVRQGDGYWSLARYIMENSGRSYIIQQEQINNRLVGEVAAAIQADLNNKGISTLNPGDLLILRDIGYYVPRLRLPGAVEEGDMTRDSLEESELKTLRDRLSYRVDHIPETSIKRPGITLEVKYVTIHSTANPGSTATSERAWLTNPENKNEAGYHLVVDEKEAIEVIPLTEVAWHATDGRGEGNSNSIGIEIVESGDREKTLENAIILAAIILKEHDLGTSALRTHHHWYAKKTDDCPRILLEKEYRKLEEHTWKWFVEAVGKLLGE